MAVDMTVLLDAGLDIEAGTKYTGNQEKYIAAVQRFFKNYEKNSSKAMEYYSSADYESYRITVHALKSNALMIGATELSTRFEGLEHAAADGDRRYLEDNHARVMESYRALVEAIRAVGETEEVHAADEIGADEARATVEKLLEALDDFDDELSKHLAIKLSGYPFRITQQEKLKNAISLIDDFSYDDAADIIREISQTIE